MLSHSYSSPEPFLRLSLPMTSEPRHSTMWLQSYRPRTTISAKHDIVKPGIKHETRKLPLKTSKAKRASLLERGVTCNDGMALYEPSRSLHNQKPAMMSRHLSKRIYDTSRPFQLLTMAKAVIDTKSIVLRRVKYFTVRLWVFWGQVCKIPNSFISRAPLLPL